MERVKTICLLVGHFFILVDRQVIIRYQRRRIKELVMGEFTMRYYSETATERTKCGASITPTNCPHSNLACKDAAKPGIDKNGEISCFSNGL